MLLLITSQCLLLSIRLNPAAVLKLLRETGASSVIVSTRTAGSIKDALVGVDGALYTAAPFDRFLEPSSTANVFQCLVSCPQSVRENDQNVIILHSSGTTGTFQSYLFTARRLNS